MSCHEPTCSAEVDAGMAYRCDGCKDHFCYAHLVHIVGRKGQFCEECAEDPTL